MTKKTKSEQYVVYGRILYAESNQPAAGLHVVAMDADLLFDDALGKVVTGKDGSYRITYDRSQFMDIGERAPDVYIQVYDTDKHLLASTKERVIHNAGQSLEINLQIPGAEEVPVTRSQFTQLILGNPNYFGTMPEFDFEPVVVMSSNTTYEELTCLGLQPDQETLEAVVVIKRPYGYKTDPCGNGSTEYVRFFIERAGVWHDLGVSSFNAYNMPDSHHPLAYTVTIPLSEPEKYCVYENLMKVRAILSWNQEPPAGNAIWAPPWGNRLDATVQIDAWNLVLTPVVDLIKEGLLTLDESLISQLNVDQPLPLKAAEPLAYTKLKELYADTDVPAHRFAFSQALAISSNPVSSDLMAQIGISNQVELIPGVELGNILDDLVATSGNTSYEELNCAGYNPQTREVGGVISIKRNSGFSGGLCTPGSTEYVGFWVEHGGSWHPLGVAEVNVHDLSGVGGGKTVEYAVVRTTNNVPEMPCEDLTGLRLRAILSWNHPPTGPGYIPTWGNIVNTYIQPPIADPIDDDELNRLRLMRFNRMPIDAISNITGRATNPVPVAGDCGGVDRPFGGTVYIEGDFVHKPHVFDNLTGDVLPGQHPLLYQVFWHKDGSVTPPTQLTNSFTIKVFPQDATLPVTKTQAVTPIGGDEYYTYMESGTQAVNPRMLAVWSVNGLDDGLYTVEAKGFAYNGSAYVHTNSAFQKIYVYNGFPHLESVMQADGTVALVPQKRPELQFTMTGGECADITEGATISGTYQVRDYFFGHLAVRMVPTTIGGTTYEKPVTISNPGSVIPHLGVTPSVQTVSGTWSMSTADLPPCGYTIELVAWDRALVGNSCAGHYNRIGLGFCLRLPEDE